MVRKQTGRKGAATGRGPSFPVSMPAQVVDDAQRRAAEIFVVPTYYFQHAVRQLVALDIPQEVIDAAIKVERSSVAPGEGGEKKSWNFLLPEDLRDPGHEAARALGFTLSAYIIVMAERLAKTPDPEYMRIPGQYLRERLQAAKRQAKRGAPSRKRMAAAAAAAEG